MSSKVGLPSPRTLTLGKTSARRFVAAVAPSASAPVTTSASFPPKPSGTTSIRPWPGPRSSIEIVPESTSSVMWGLSLPTSTAVGSLDGDSISSSTRTMGTVNPVVSSVMRAVRSGTPSAPRPGTTTTSIALGICPPPRNPAVVYRLERSRLLLAPPPGRDPGPRAGGVTSVGRTTWRSAASRVSEARLRKRRSSEPGPAASPPRRSHARSCRRSRA